MINQIIVKWITMRINVWSSVTISHEILFWKTKLRACFEVCSFIFFTFSKTSKWVSKHTDSARNKFVGQATLSVFRTGFLARSSVIRFVNGPVCYRLVRWQHVCSVVRSKGVQLKKNVRTELEKNEFFIFPPKHQTRTLGDRTCGWHDCGGKIDRETTAMVRVVFIGYGLMHVNGR